MCIYRFPQFYGMHNVQNDVILLSPRLRKKFRENDVYTNSTQCQESSSQINVFMPIWVNNLLSNYPLPNYSKYVAVVNIEAYLVNFHFVKSFATQNRTFGVWEQNFVGDISKKY